MVKILALLVVFTIIGGSICAQQIESRTQEDKLRALKQFLTKTHQNKKKLIEKFQIENNCISMCVKCVHQIRVHDIENNNFNKYFTSECVDSCVASRDLKSILANLTEKKIFTKNFAKCLIAEVIHFEYFSKFK